MAEFDPDAFLAGQETKVEKTKTTEDKQPEVATQQAAASDTSGFDPDAFLSGQTEQAQQAQATAKASALAKLTALGLTQAEVTALIG